MHLDVVYRERCLWRNNLRISLYVSFILLHCVTVTFSQCITGAYLATLPDGSKDCKLCQICPGNYREVRKCASNHDASCCPPWTYTPLSSTKCKTCKNCSPGFYVKQKCKADSDTVCEPCPNKTFTNSNDTSICIACTECDSIAPCTSVSDTVCKEDSTVTSTIAAVVIVTIVVVVAIVVLCIVYKRKHRGHQHTDSNQKSSKGSETVAGEQIELGGISSGVDNTTNMNNPTGGILKQEEHEKHNSDTNDNRSNISKGINETKRDVPVKGGRQDQTTDTNKNRTNLSTKEIKKDIELTSEQDELPYCVRSSIGVIVDSYTKREWVVSRVGTKYALTVSDAYVQIEEERKRRNMEHETIKGVHMFFICQGTPVAFKFTQEPVYINHKLNVMVLEVLDLCNLPTHLQLNTEPMISKSGEVNIITCSWDQPTCHTVTKANQLCSETVERLLQIKPNTGKSLNQFVFLNDSNVSFKTGSPGFGSSDKDTFKMDFIYTNSSPRDLQFLQDSEKQSLLEENKFAVCTSLHAVYNDMLKNKLKKIAENIFCSKF